MDRLEQSMPSQVGTLVSLQRTEHEAGIVNLINRVDRLEQSVPSEVGTVASVALFQVAKQVEQLCSKFQDLEQIYQSVEDLSCSHQKLCLQVDDLEKNTTSMPNQVPQMEISLHKASSEATWGNEPSVAPGGP